MIDRTKVYAAVDSERDWQDRKWGTIQQHPHEVGGWLTIVRKLLRDAEDAWASNSSDEAALHEIRKIIGTGVACAEQYGLPSRYQHSTMEHKRHG